MVASLLLLPDGDEPAARIDAGSDQHLRGRGRRDPRPDASRSDRREAQLPGANALDERAARSAFDNAAARSGAAVVHERKVRARIQARKARLKAKRLRRAARLAAMEKTSTFRIGALNILGSQHSAGPGGYGPGTDRAAMAAGLVMSRGVDVLTMSEVQDDQLAVLNGRLGGYSIWPAALPGQQRPAAPGRLALLAVRDARRRLGHLHLRQPGASRMPYVLLRDRGTGAEFWVISIHTSAGGLEGERDAGIATAISLMQRLRGAVRQAGDHRRRRQRARGVLLQGLRLARLPRGQRRRRRLLAPAPAPAGGLDHGRRRCRRELLRLRAGRGYAGQDQ